MCWRILILVATTLLVSACESASKSSPTPNNQPMAQPTTFTGTLQSGVMGIGGEHTGWILVGDGETGGIEVDVSNVKQIARQLAGKRVTIKGKIGERNYTERGKTAVLVAESISEAPKSASNRPAGA
jgi:hypothetical protein